MINSVPNYCFNQLYLFSTSELSIKMVENSEFKKVFYENFKFAFKIILERKGLVQNRCYDRFILFIRTLL